MEKTFVICRLLAKIKTRKYTLFFFLFFCLFYSKLKSNPLTLNYSVIIAYLHAKWAQAIIESLKQLLLEHSNPFSLSYIFKRKVKYVFI
jgi:hypothetical protein